jgi:hypothetical protein
MVDLPDASVLVAGLDHWRYEISNIPRIEEPRLVAKLESALGIQQLTLRAPPPASDQDFGFRPDIGAWRFPEWFIVQNTQITKRGFRRRRLVHLNSLDGGKFRDADGKKQVVVPVRFVRACRKGHLGDIGWKEFVHGSFTHCPRELHLEERGTSGRSVDYLRLRRRTGNESGREDGFEGLGLMQRVAPLAWQGDERIVR